MVYEDKVYGSFRIEEPVILDLIKSKPIQRLKDIEQGGYIPLYYNPKSLPLNKISHSRFEHSLVVFLLLKKFKASLVEQIAGLIHDASHAAFSHCIDYVLAEGSQKKT
jgi:HD superfamily phosphohydrolase